MFCVTTFYKIFALSAEDSIKMQNDIKSIMQANDIKGTVLIGENEGINATIAALPENLAKFYDYTKSHSLLND